MTETVVCKKCKVKPQLSYGVGSSSVEAYDFCEIKCPKCFNFIKVFSQPNNSSKTAEDAIELWNKKNYVKFKKKKKCKSCDQYVDVGYDGNKKCLNKGECDL